MRSMGTFGSCGAATVTRVGRLPLRHKQASSIASDRGYPDFSPDLTRASIPGGYRGHGQR